MNDLIEFLRARLDEDEQKARGCSDYCHPEWSDGGEYGEAVHDTAGSAIACGPYDYMHDSVRGHIARHDPARVLREVATKRLIVGEHECLCPNPACTDCGACSGSHHADPTDAPCQTLRLLAAVYDDHPDYRAEWAPDTP